MKAAPIWCLACKRLILTLSTIIRFLKEKCLPVVSRALPLQTSLPLVNIILAADLLKLYESNIQLVTYCVDRRSTSECRQPRPLTFLPLVERPNKTLVFRSVSAESGGTGVYKLLYTLILKAALVALNSRLSFTGTTRL